MFYKQNTKKGFTLVELMVAIAIISVLTAVVYASFDRARKKARDNQRIAALKQLQAAVEIYGQAHGQYPNPGCGSTTWTGHGTAVGSCTDYISSISSIISPLPVDPNNNEYGYLYYSNGFDYKILAYLTVEGAPVTAGQEYARFPQGITCPWDTTITGPHTITYAVYSPGAACW